MAGPGTRESAAEAPRLAQAPSWPRSRRPGPGPRAPRAAHLSGDPRRTAAPRRSSGSLPARRRQRRPRRCCSCGAAAQVLPEPGSAAAASLAPAPAPLGTLARKEATLGPRRLPRSPAGAARLPEPARLPRALTLAPRTRPPPAPPRHAHRARRPPPSPEAAARRAGRARPVPSRPGSAPKLSARRCACGLGRRRWVMQSPGTSHPEERPLHPGPRSSQRPRHCPSAPWVGVFRTVSCWGGSASVLGPAGSTPPLGFRDVGPCGSRSALCRPLPPSCPYPVLTCPARGQVLPGTWKIPAAGPGDQRWSLSCAHAGGLAGDRLFPACPAAAPEGGGPGEEREGLGGLGPLGVQEQLGWGDGQGHVAGPPGQGWEDVPAPQGTGTGTGTACVSLQVMQLPAAREMDAETPCGVVRPPLQEGPPGASGGSRGSRNTWPSLSKSGRCACPASRWPEAPALQSPQPPPRASWGPGGIPEVVLPLSRCKGCSLCLLPPLGPPGLLLGLHLPLGLAFSTLTVSLLVAEGWAPLTTGLPSATAQTLPLPGRPSQDPPQRGACRRPPSRPPPRPRGIQ